MNKIIDFDSLARDFLSMVEGYGMSPVSYGISLTLSKERFDEIVKVQPELAPHPGIILIIKTEKSGLQWSIQLLREFTMEDFPPGLILKP